MFWRRRLPHWVPEEAVVFVTWRLAGTMPRPEAEILLSDPTPGKRFVRFDRELDRAVGPRWLEDSCVAKMLTQARMHGEAPLGTLSAPRVGGHAKSHPHLLETPLRVTKTNAMAEDRNGNPRQSHSWPELYSFLAQGVFRSLDSIGKGVVVCHRARRKEPGKGWFRRVTNVVAMVRCLEMKKNRRQDRRCYSH